jgi:hypothetical protein
LHYHTYAPPQLHGVTHSIDYLDQGGRKTGTGWFWTASRPGGDLVFQWETSRASSCLGNLLPADFTSTLQCDDYGAYPMFARNHPHPVMLAGCWAHVRRKFDETRNQPPPLITAITMANLGGSANGPSQLTA